MYTLTNDLFNKNNYLVYPFSSLIIDIDENSFDLPKITSLGIFYQKQIEKQLNSLKSNKFEELFNSNRNLIINFNNELNIQTNVINNYFKLIMNQELDQNNMDKFINSNLCHNELLLIKNNLSSIKEQLYINLYVITSYLNKSRLDKYNIINSNKRNTYSRYHDKLLKERTKLINAIHEFNERIKSSNNLLNENEYLLRNISHFRNFNYLFKSPGAFINKSDEFIHNIQLICEDTRNKLKLINNKDLINKIDELIEKTLILVKQLKNAINNKKNDLINKYIDLLKNNLSELFKILSISNHEINNYTSIHDNEYQECLKELTNLITKYQISFSNTYITNWDIKSLTNDIKKYVNQVKLMNHLTKDSLNKEKYQELNESLYELNYYRFILNPTKLIGGENELEYYKNKLKDLLKEIRLKYHLTFNDQEDEIIINDLINNHQLNYLYELLYGNFSIFNFNIAFDMFKNPENMTINNLRNFIQRITRTSLDNDHDSYLLGNYPNISLDELFYILKFLQRDNYNINELFIKEEEGKPVIRISTRECDIESLLFKKLISKCYMNYQEKNYHSEVFVIRQEISVYDKKIGYSEHDVESIND